MTLKIRSNRDNHQIYLEDVRFGGRGLHATGAGRIPLPNSCLQINEHSVVIESSEFLYPIIDHSFSKK